MINRNSNKFIALLYSFHGFILVVSTAVLLINGSFLANAILFPVGLLAVVAGVAIWKERMLGYAIALLVSVFHVFAFIRSIVIDIVNYKSGYLSELYTGPLDIILKEFMWPFVLFMQLAGINKGFIHLIPPITNIAVIITIPLVIFILFKKFKARSTLSAT